MKNISLLAVVIALTASPMVSFGSKDFDSAEAGPSTPSSKITVPTITHSQDGGKISSIQRFLSIPAKDRGVPGYIVFLKNVLDIGAKIELEKVSNESLSFLKDANVDVAPQDRLPTLYIRAFGACPSKDEVEKAEKNEKQEASACRKAVLFAIYRLSQLQMISNTVEFPSILQRTIFDLSISNSPGNTALNFFNLGLNNPEKSGEYIEKALPSILEVWKTNPKEGLLLLTHANDMLPGTSLKFYADNNAEVDEVNIRSAAATLAMDSLLGIILETRGNTAFGISIEDTLKYAKESTGDFYGLWRSLKAALNEEDHPDFELFINTLSKKENPDFDLYEINKKEISEIIEVIKEIEDLRLNEGSDSEADKDLQPLSPDLSLKPEYFNDADKTLGLLPAVYQKKVKKVIIKDILANIQSQDVHQLDQDYVKNQCNISTEDGVQYMARNINKKLRLVYTFEQGNLQIHYIGNYHKG